MARVRNRTSAVVPQELVTLNAVEDCMERVLAQALSTLDGPVDMLDRAAQLLGGLEPGEVDGALEAHVTAIDLLTTSQWPPASPRLARCC